MPLYEARCVVHYSAAVDSGRHSVSSQTDTQILGVSVFLPDRLSSLPLSLPRSLSPSLWVPAGHGARRRRLGGCVLGARLGAHLGGALRPPSMSIFAATATSTALHKLSGARPVARRARVTASRARLVDASRGARLGGASGGTCL